MSEYPLKPLQPTYADRFKLLTLSFPHPQVLHLQINMGPVNAFTAELSREYDEAFALIGDDPTVRAIVLSSALPKHFCAGIDLSFLAAICPPAPDPSRCALLQVVALQHATSTPSRCPIPVIAAVHGAALGLGLDLLGPVDIIYAASDAAFGAKEVTVGLAAGVGTLAYHHKRVWNKSPADELCLTGRTFGAEEALQLGLVSKVVPGSREGVVEAALAVARVVAENRPSQSSGRSVY